MFLSRQVHKRAVYVSLVVLMLIAIVALDGRVWQRMNNVDAAAPATKSVAKLPASTSHSRHLAISSAPKSDDLTSATVLSAALHAGKSAYAFPEFSLSPNFAQQLEMQREQLATVAGIKPEFHSSLYPVSSSLRFIREIPGTKEFAVAMPPATPMNPPACITCILTPVVSGGCANCSVAPATTPPVTKVPDIGNDAIYIALLFMLGVAYIKRSELFQGA